MPKIPVYTGNGSVIPVAEARLDSGYQCHLTGEVFLLKREFINHLKYVRGKIHSKIRRKNHNKIIKEFNSVSSFIEMMKWIEEHQTFFFDHIHYDSMKKLTKKDRDSFRFTINSLKLVWENKVSNSHGCPRNGVTNWGGREKLKDGTPAPSGYPGWRGTINYSMSSFPTFFSDIFRGLGLHTGTGGGRGDSFESEFYMFAADWPNLSQEVTASILKGEKVPQFIYYGSRKAMYENS